MKHLFAALITCLLAFAAHAAVQGKGSPAPPTASDSWTGPASS